MSEAGTKGAVGPNLDFAYVGDRLQGMVTSSFESMVREQIESPDPRGVMPANLAQGIGRTGRGRLCGVGGRIAAQAPGAQAEQRHLAAPNSPA